MRGKASYFAASPTTPAAKVAALSLLFAGIGFALLYPALSSTASQAPATFAPGSSWGALKKRESQGAQ